MSPFKAANKPHTIPLLVRAKGPVTEPVSFVFDSVVVGFVAAAAVEVSDPKVAHPSQIQPLHPEWPGPIPAQSVA